MRSFFLFICLVGLITVYEGDVAAQSKKGQYIHPSFEFLLKTHPRNKTIENPMVPRISAKTALNLYRANRAVFFAAGQMAIKAALPGAINITDNMINNPPKRFLSKYKNRNIVIFCH